MKRKKWLIVFGAAILTAALATLSFAASPIKLIVNGQEIKPDVPPQIINDRTMVPVRWVAEALGADVQWSNNRVIKLTSLGIDKMERISSKIAAPEGSLSILTVYSSIIGITATGQNVTVYVQPQDAGYDFVAVEPPVANLPYKESGSGEKMSTFIFTDTKGKELTRVVKM
ncbi:hypothetical protein GFC01_09645 [Desulfofundulus thermobenzoicus]|uniref:Copper amine oxidase-like N-terminal domain-containing protein n=1 Tax=Desulfofundulus thermobenzoicus TaxID=29376 RepID=A0A6N7ISM9_9FIRM|nr:hypothetical protein [Desulfofundulus thermobenzoicus]